MLEPISLFLPEVWSILGKPGPERPQSVNGSVFWNAKTPQAPNLLFRRQRSGTGYSHPVLGDLGHGTGRTLPVLARGGRAGWVQG